MAKKDNSGNWINRNGNSVPQENIKPYIKRRDRVVTKIILRAMKLRRHMEKEKTLMIKEVDKLSKYLSAKLDLKDLTPEGNLQLSDYSSLMQVCFAKNDIIEFDERLNMAKALIDKCLKKWSKSANNNLRAIINEAFRVDKKGNVNKAMIFGLLKYEVNDEDWNKAMYLIEESMEVKGSRQYLQFKVRDNIGSKFESINLNFSSL